VGTQALRKRRPGLGGELAGKGKWHPLPPRQLSITIKHFNDLLSDKPLDFIIIHQVSLRKEGKNCLNYTFKLGVFPWKQTSWK
jgi:hypothetical protein